MGESEAPGSTSTGSGPGERNTALEGLYVGTGLAGEMKPLEGDRFPLASSVPGAATWSDDNSDVDPQTVLNWGIGPHRVSTGCTAIELIERQALNSAQRVALLFGEQTWTYAELDAEAETLSRRLVAAGVGPEVVVGLSVDRTPRMLAAMLAIWKAGGAYLPLDSKLPTVRLKYQVENSGLRLALVDHDEWVAWSVPGLRVLDLRTIDTQESAESLAREAEGPVSKRRGGDPAQLAYILYTSGSTGRPKGVEVTQAALVNLMESMREAPGCGPDDVVLATTTYTFDISLLELFLPLVSGARLVLADTRQLLDPAAMDGLLQRWGVTLAQATPSAWWSLVHGGWRGGPHVRVIIGGEALSADLALAVLERAGEIWNGYGPTETTIYSTMCRVGASQELTSIGSPVGNTQVDVLDGQRRLVSYGHEGELWIAGAGVARGYRGRPDLTAERFADDCVAVQPGTRMYATGDLVRWLDDGTLSYLVRRDHQVKIRGFRIELGEIEALLCLQPGVTGAVATVSGGDQPQLVGHVLAAEGTWLDGDQLRRVLRDQLPDYMVPGVVVQVPAFPLTNSGKIDRRALAERDVNTVRSGGREPRTELERRVA